MTGRMYLLPAKDRLPKHAAVVLKLGRENFVFEDTRYFGRLTLDSSALARLGPEPLGAEFTAERFAEALGRSRQAIKVKLLDQSLLAGVGNIYASEALFRAGIAPTLPARRLTAGQVQTALARRSRGAQGGHRVRQHRPAELRRPGSARWALLFWQGARRAGLLRGAVAGLRSRGPAVPGVRDGDQATGASGPQHILLPALPARLKSAGRNPKTEGSLKPEIRTGLS